jgi:hypothetical protein
MAAVAVGIYFLGAGAEVVAGLAGQAVVGAVEREIGIRAMIEFRVSPSPDDVAVLAFLAIQLVMRIVVAMATVAVAYRVFLFLGGVSGLVTVIA